MKPTRIPSLDGLRFLSILFVVMGHATNADGFPHWLRFFRYFPGFGVRIFFVISGFLITTLLLEERKRTGAISLKGFYIRRAYRILPAAYAVILGTSIVLWHYLSWVDIVAASLYVENYVSHPSWPLGHLWSLAVEEQFYLLWPFLLLTFYKHRAKILLAAIVTAPLFRIAVLAFHNNHASATWFFCVQDALAMGCLLAVYREKAAAWGSKYLDGSFAGAVIATTAILLNVFTYPHGIQPLVVLPLMNFLIAASIEGLTRWDALFSRLLNLKPVVWLGTLSYSIYLVQMPFFTPGIHNWLTRFPYSLLWIMLAAIVCHYGVEQPFLRLRKRREQ